MIFMMQMFLILILLVDVLDNVFDYREGLSRLSYLTSHHAYINLDATSEGQVIYLNNHEEESIKKAKVLYQYISDVTKKNHIKTYTCMERFYELNHKTVQVFAVNSFFFESLKIDLEDGDFFRDGETDTLPMIIGNGLKTDFKFGRQYAIPDMNGEETESYVSGVMKKKSSIPSLHNIGSVESLDHAIIIPIQERFLNSFPNLDMAFNATVYFADNVSVLEQIKEKTNELHLFSPNYISIQDSIEEYASVLKEKMDSRIKNISLAMIFVVGSMVLEICSMIERKRKDFSVFLMIGFDHNMIIRMFSAHILLLIMPGFLFSTFLFGFDYKTYMALLFSLFICGITTALIGVKFRKSNIVENLQRGDL